MSHLLPRQQPMRMAVSFEVPHETADRLSFKTWKFADMWLLLPQLLSPWPMHRAMSRRSARPVCQMRLAKFFLVFLANIANMTWCCARTASMATSSLDAALFWPIYLQVHHRFPLALRLSTLQMVPAHSGHRVEDSDVEEKFFLRKL